MDLELLRQLCETPGVPGREERVRALLEMTIKGLFDDVRNDGLECDKGFGQGTYGDSYRRGMGCRRYCGTIAAGARTTVPMSVTPPAIRSATAMVRTLM